MKAKQKRWFAHFQNKNNERDGSERKNLETGWTLDRSKKKVEENNRKVKSKRSLSIGPGSDRIVWLLF